MSDSPATGLQESYLNDARKRHQSLVIYLINGLAHRGVIESFDQHTVKFRTGNETELIYKHTIASVLPAPKQLRDKKLQKPIVLKRSSTPSPTPVIVRKTPRKIKLPE